MPPSPPAISVPHVAVLSGLAVVVAVMVAQGPLGGIPHLSDEVAYTLQSKLFAAGMRTGPAGDVPAMLTYPFWQTAPHSFSPFPPGWPALLAVGEKVGLAWLVNPLLAGLLPWLTWLLAHEYTGDEATARLAALVAALSPGIWVLSASRMSHTGVLVALLGATVVVTGARDRPWAWVLAGLGVAYVVTARQYDAVLVGGPLIALGLWRAPGWAARAPLVVLPGLATALVLWDNQALTGDPLTFPMNQWFDTWSGSEGRTGCNALGFGEGIGCYPTLGSWGHTPAKAAQHAAATVQRLDRFLLGVPGSLLLAAYGAWKLRRWEPLALTVLLVGGYALYFSPGIAYGARFWHPLYIALPTLCAVGLARLGRYGGPAVLLAVFVGGSGIARDLADRWWCVDPGLDQLLASRGIDDGVVLVYAQGTRGMSWPALGVDDFGCDRVLELGDVFWRMDPTATDRGLQIRHAPSTLSRVDAYLDDHQPGRAAWLVRHDIPTDQLHLSELRAAPDP